MVFGSTIAAVSVARLVTESRDARWKTSESNRTVGADSGYDDGKRTEKRSTEPAYGPDCQTGMFHTPCPGGEGLPRWTKKQPCHLSRVSGEGMTYMPVGQFPAALREALRVSSGFTAQS